VSEALHGDLPGAAAARGGLRLLRVHADRPAADAAVLRVKIVGFDPEQRRRLAEILAGAPGVEVTGGQGHVVVEPMPTFVVPDQGRPKLSPRQRDVLVAYASGNDLLPVVARRLGMDQETLKTHLRRLRVKYRSAGRPAPTRRDLYVRAVEDGLVPPPS
jgi:DNA-binding CsgD family transcriptional regulator